MIYILLIYLLVVRSDFNTEFPHPDHRTRLLALLPAPLGFTLVCRDDRNPGQLVRLLLLLLLLGTHFRAGLHYSCWLVSETAASEGKIFYSRFSANATIIIN